MAVYQKKNGKWYFSLMIRGKRYHRGVQEANCKRDAEKAETVFKAELLQGRYNLAERKGEMFFNELVKEYANYAMTSKISWEKDLSRVKSLKAFFNGKKLNDITPILVEKYRFHRKKHKKKNGDPITNASINRETSILRKMFSIAVDSEWIDTNPCLARKVKPLREDSKRERYLQPDEEKKLLKYCTGKDSHLKPILICALHTGMRRGEILNLKWSWIDLKKGYITVTKTKSGKDRNIPISPVLMQELTKLEKTKKTDYVFVNLATQKPYGKTDKSFKMIIKKANIENLRFHDLRHTAATRMVASGVEIIVVQDILGHSDIRTTMRYAHPMPERKVKAIQALSNYGKKSKIVAFKSNLG